jgi:hypothetical protein
MIDITIASYNMSTASGIGLYKRRPLYPDGHEPSEIEFIVRAQKPYEFFKIAIQHLKNFIREHEPAAIGLQEFPKAKTIKIKGYERLRACHPASSACIVTLWKKAVFGSLQNAYIADLGETPGLPYEAKDLDRPISICLTEGGFVLINLHGPRDAKTKAYATLLAKAIQIHYGIAMKDFGNPTVSADRILLMGDFNDSDSHLRVKIDGHAFQGMVQGLKSCCFPNYTYTGDYCLGQHVVKPLKIYPSPTNPDGGSQASDHELVFARFRVPH